ncbi:MAG: DUF393 domain-containing protein [Bryobacteraceae bacterium]
MTSIIYDGDCGFCTRSVRTGMALDWLKTLRWLPRFSDEAMKLGVSLEASERALQMVQGTTVYSGWRAIKRMALRFPLFWIFAALATWLWPWSALVIALGLSPLANPIGDPVYAWIARNRMRISGGACALPERPPAERPR